MCDIEQALDQFIYSKFINTVNRIYILKGFYDIYINDSVYSGVNMLTVNNGVLKIYSIDSMVFSINYTDVCCIAVYKDYRKLNFIVKQRQ